MTQFTPFASTLGGLILGVASSLLLVFNGRLCGVSGIVGGLATAKKGDRRWRIAFVGGLLSGGAGLALLDRGMVALASEQSVALAIPAGLLVGLGTRMGNGCTSGHGLCGIALLSRRSIVATIVFLATGAATVFVTRNLLQGAKS